MAGHPPVLDPASAPTHGDPRFEPRDQGGATRQDALRLARAAGALPPDQRWLYLRAVRSVGRLEGVAGLAKLELVERPSDADLLRDATELMAPPRAEPARAARRRPPHRSLRAFALTGVLVGMAVALLLPASLSESLPGTSGNDREPLAARPNAPDGGAAASRGGAESDAGRDSQPREASGASNGDNRAVPRPQADDRRHLGGERGVSGRGDGVIGNLRVDRPMRLRWKSGGKAFAIVSEDWRFTPRSASGSTVLTPGTYRDLTVKSTGSWTISLSPAAR
jgi:hypothetical protein